MQFWAHRGAGKGPLENTMQGFELALTHEFDSVEFDVMVSADARLYVHHDFTLGRLAVPAPGSSVDPRAHLASLDSEQLKQVYVAGQPILPFEHLAEFLLQHGLQANVELKADTPSNARRLGLAMTSFLGSQPARVLSRISELWVFSSFYHASMLPLTGYRKALLYESLDDFWAVRADALLVEAVHLHWSGATPEAVRRIHATGRKVRVYTVNQRQESERLALLGVDGLFTDCIDRPVD